MVIHTFLFANVVDLLLEEAQMTASAPIAKVTLFGDARCGKSALWKRFLTGDFAEKYRATIGVDFGTKNVEVGDRSVVLQVWDAAGDERFMSLGVAYVKGTRVAIIVFDLSNAESFSHVDDWRDFGTHFKDELPPRLMLVGTKSDLCFDRKVPQKAITEWCAKNADADGQPVPYFEVSSKDNSGTTEVFLAAAKMYLDKWPTSDKSKESAGLPQNVASSETKAQPRGCCVLM